MANFIRNILIGVGIGLLVAPMRGEELRRLIGERFQQAQNSLPENSQLKQYTQQVTDRVSQGAQNLQTYAQQAASEVKNSASNLGNIASNATGEVKQAGQDVADTTKQNVNAVQQNANAPQQPKPTTTIRPDNVDLGLPPTNPTNY
jgi:gas vesicle protein